MSAKIHPPPSLSQPNIALKQELFQGKPKNYKHILSQCMLHPTEPVCLISTLAQSFPRLFRDETSISAYSLYFILIPQACVVFEMVDS